jgi:hypothetical protein
MPLKSNGLYAESKKGSEIVVVNVSLWLAHYFLF